ncbi:MAG TPA: hypothetical protein VGX25_35330 [Actinophytocola sp.]|uniref:terminase small subunit n=1 Tax=Actinophytocola sp. TaxID=1872138 RepID=UPI002DDD230C|nr:hypothetical protein [Actinophytocola sp.]HEV2784687.1 hypothetical protein [Actinophytocola sp.]
MAGDETSMSEALDVAFESVQTRPEDGAAVALARQYAGQIDADGEALPKVGPLLLAVLVELGMTPRARAAVVGKGGAPRDGKRSRLDELRDDHRARVDGAAAVDTAAS